MVHLLFCLGISGLGCSVSVAAETSSSVLSHRDEITWPHAMIKEAVKATPSQEEVISWLRLADESRGGFAGYSWNAVVRSFGNGSTLESRYTVDVNDGKALLTTQYPERQRGQRMLIDGRNMWFAKEELRRPVKISIRQRLSGEASNGDIAAVQYSRDYDASYLGIRSTFDGREAHAVDLTARVDNVAYPSIVYYIDPVDFVGVAADFMTSNGTIFKRATFDYVEQNNDSGEQRPFVKTMTIANAAFPERYSEITYSDVVRANHSPSMFRVSSLSSR